MTQPPGYYGQPGPDPYGQQQPPPGGGGYDPYGQQQPGYSDPYGQPPSDGSYGGYSDPYAQPVSDTGYAGSGYPAQDYGQQQPGYGPPPAYDPYGQPVTGPPGPPGQPWMPQPPPKKNNTGMLVGIIGLVAVLLIGGIIGGFLLLKDGGGGTTGSPTGAVEGFLTAVFKDGDTSAANKFVCEAQRGKGDLDDLKDAQDAAKAAGGKLDITWSNVKELSRDGDKAKVSADLKVTATVGGQSRTNSGKMTFEVVKESGEWRVCDADTS